MALQMDVNKFGQTFTGAYHRIHRMFGSKQEGVVYTIRTYANRAAYQANINNHLEESQINMPFPPNNVSLKFPDDCYSHMKAQATYKNATDVIETGQTAAVANASI